MAVFLVRYSPSGNAASLSQNMADLAPFLPRKPRKAENVTVGPCEAIIFYFDAALDRQPIRIGPDEHILCHGYGNGHLENRIARSFADRLPLNLDCFPEAFCAIRMHQGGVDFGGSAVGTDPLFFFEDGGDLIITNRHNLLGYWVRSANLRKDAFAWMLGRSHIGDFGTYWADIKRTRPGSLYRKTDDELIETKADFSNLYAPIADNEIPAHIAEVANEFGGVLDNDKHGARLWLSGGKDSRAIAGLLSNAERFNDMSFQTHGEKFAPDAMSAQRVAERLGIADKHAVLRLGITAPSVDIAAAIATDIAADSSGGSLADFRGIPQSNLLIFGGHENGYKTKPNTLNLDAYLDSRKYWTDNVGILTKDAYSRISDWYLNELRELISEAPKSRYPQLDALMFRNGTFLTGSLVNAHVSRSEIHPFLDGRMVRLLLGISDEALQNQIIHYVMMRQNQQAIESVPFAADHWPSGTVAMAKAIGLPFRENAQPAYKFQPYFPSQRVFGGYSWRLDLIRRTKSFVQAYVSDNNSFFDFIDKERMALLAERQEETLRITDFYYHLSLLKVCIIHHFSTSDKLFRFDLSSDVALEISQLFDASATKSASEAEIIASFNQKLDDYENAIALIAERDRGPTISATADVAATITKYLPAGEVRDAALREAGMINVDHSGTLIGKLQRASKASGIIISGEKQSNKALLAIKGPPATAAMNTFSWSDAGQFWFKYLPTEDEISEFEIDIPALEAGGEVWILPWYAQNPIWVQASCSKK